MSSYLWGILTGVIGAIAFVILVCLAVGASIVFCCWVRWKKRQIRARREWTMENPYWEEAFDAGAKWAEEGKPPMVPFLARLKMPGE